MDAQLVALAAGAAQTLVSAMTTDAWSSVRDRFARLIGRGDGDAVARAGASLDDARTLAASGDSAAVTGRWQGRLEMLVEQHPEAAGELAALVAEVAAGDGARPMRIHADSGRDTYIAGRDQVIRHSSN